MIFEICTDSLAGVVAAQEQKCKRIELCAALSVGGLTPSIGLVIQCVGYGDIEIHAMIRPREGDFVYQNDEISVMKNNIQQLALAGVKGVVFGVLNDDGTIATVNFNLLKLAKSLGLEVTFHRAFDFVKNMHVAIEVLIAYGFDRILTSGLAETAEIGLPVLEKLQANYGGQIQIMAGSGVTVLNIQKFADIGIEQVHFTARKPVSKSTKLDMGTKMEVDIEKIKNMVSIF